MPTWTRMWRKDLGKANWISPKIEKKDPTSKIQATTTEDTKDLSDKLDSNEKLYKEHFYRPNCITNLFENPCMSI